jgi:magnesium chelatase subunit H
MKVAALYVGSSLPAALRRAERDINRQYGLGLSIALHNCTSPLGDAELVQMERDVAQAEIVFLIHVTDSENSTRICAALDRRQADQGAVIAMSCLPELMRRTRLRKLDFASLMAPSNGQGKSPVQQLARRLGSWMWRNVASRRGGTNGHRPEDYLKLAAQAPLVLRYVPNAGALGDIKRYITLYCYLMQPTPPNIRGLVLYAIKHYVDGPHTRRIRVEAPETKPSTGIYHPDAHALFPTFEAYRTWYEARTRRLDANETIALLLMRPQVISGAHAHYAELIRALEREGLPVLPVLSTFMDNRQACERFLVDPDGRSPRFSQLMSLTGFSFVGGPAMNDSEAAVAYLKDLNRPLRTSISLETQRTETWAESMIGLNPVQAAMQVAIPEIDGASEPFVYAGTARGGVEPEALPDRCERIARRARRWNRLRNAPRRDLRIAFVIYCFPPNKGNLGTAADMDVFPSLWEILRRLEREGYAFEAPLTPDHLRSAILGADGALANVAARIPADEYYRLCPHVDEIEAEWGPAPGRINVQGRDLLIHGTAFGRAFIAVQPTFGYEGDPMKLLMAHGGTPHHGFMALYLYLEKILQADAVVHVGTHGALEFMPGKQAGLSSKCWPDRLIGELPNIYLYSVNNPSEGAIAKRRSYAGLISYLTSPIENAGLYKDFAALKDLIAAYRQTADERRREQLFAAIEEKSRQLNLAAR